MTKSNDEIELIDYIIVIWKRKWSIIGGTLGFIIIAIILSFLLPPIWEVDAIFLPGKFITQTEQGAFEEVLVTDAEQIAGQIEEESFNNQIATELGIDIRRFPKIRAQNLKNTNLVRVSVKDKDAAEAVSILNSLFGYVKEEMNRKINAEIKGLDTRMIANERQILKKGLDIKSNDIDIAKIKQEIVSLEKKLKISEERSASIEEEMKTVKKRIDTIEKHQQEALTEQREEVNALGLLLYSNEVQRNFQYYNTLDEKLSDEKITQENLRYRMKERSQEIKHLQTRAEILDNEIDIIKNENELLKERKQRFDHAQFVKKPTVSLSPVFPKRMLFIVVAAVAGGFVFIFMAFFVEYLRQKKEMFP